MIYYSVVDVLDRSTPVPCPHPGFCLLAKFLLQKIKKRFSNYKFKTINIIIKYKQFIL